MGYKVKKIYQGTNLVRPVWPGANTLAYYPLTASTTVNDLSGNGRTLTNNGVSFGTYQGVNCAYFNGSGYLGRSESLFTGNATFSINVWCYRTTTTSFEQNIVSVGTATGTNSFIIWLYGSSMLLYTGGWTNDRNTGYTFPLNKRVNLGVSHKNGTIKVYINGSLIYTGTVSYGIQSGNTYIGTGVQGASNSQRWYGYMSEFILENKTWTADEISNYYNSTKSNYGL